MNLKKIPDFTLPAVFAWLGQKLPQTPPTWILMTALNALLDRLIPRSTFEPLTGKRFEVVVTDAGLHLRFNYDGRAFHTGDTRAAADLKLSARARDFIALINREEDPDTLFFSRRLLTEGDTELGLLVKNTLDGLDLPHFDPQRPWDFIKELTVRWKAQGPRED